jgi:putative glutamine amidotransferase
VKDAPGFTLAVQWHPEWDAANDPVSRPLFERFGAAARAWVQGKQQGLLKSA